MTIQKNKVRAEFDQCKGSWAFVDPRSRNFRIPFDSALVEVTRSGPGMVEGYVLSVHGVPMEIASQLSVEGCRTIGINAIPALSRARAGGPVARLLENGRIERM